MEYLDPVVEKKRSLEFIISQCEHDNGPIFCDTINDGAQLMSASRIRAGFWSSVVAPKASTAAPSGDTRSLELCLLFEKGNTMTQLQWEY